MSLDVFTLFFYHFFGTPMHPITEQALKQLFTEARTFSHWLPKDVSEAQLKSIYELMKHGPTSANLSPARIVFIKSNEEKEKLIACLSPLNIEKVKSAPVTAIIAQDNEFYEFTEKLFPHAPEFKNYFVGNKEFIQSTAFRNSSLQGAYFIMAARALGLDCGPMSGFDNQKVDDRFFKGTTYSSNLICNIGYGDKEKLFPRLPRLDFDEACKII